jgi:hypothetical protein
MASIPEKVAPILDVLREYDAAIPGGWITAPTIFNLHPMKLSYRSVLDHLKAMVLAGSVEMKRGTRGLNPHLFRIAQKG